jgi:intracellular sulfur oxidation DsrE/DsrF family protein
MGRGAAPLPEVLLEKYLRLRIDDGDLPLAVCFYTEGVFLVTEGSPVLGVLRELEALGVRLVVCQTCLNHYGLAARCVHVGIVGGMGDILAAQSLARKVITL